MPGSVAEGLRALVLVATCLNSCSGGLEALRDAATHSRRRPVAGALRQSAIVWYAESAGRVPAPTEHNIQSNCADAHKQTIQ